MSLPVALQSVLFYVVACTPCAQVRHRKKARKQAKIDRAEKARFEAEQPDLYRHPDPFSTNPYWTEEIMMGPRLQKKGRRTADASHNTSQRGLTSAGQDSGIGTESSSAGSNTPAATKMDVPDILSTVKPPDQDHDTSGTLDRTQDAVPRGPGSISESEPTIVASSSWEPTSPTLTQTASESTGDGWNFKRYQREDEELWGHGISKTGQQLMDALKQAGTSAGRYVEAKLGMEKQERQVTDDDRHAFYFTPKNPPVNDYHPPVVSSRPARADGHRWMLQPPPSAKVMEGRVPVSRSTSMASVTSRRTAATTDSFSLNRLVAEKAVEAKIRQGEAVGETAAIQSTSTLARPLTRRTTTATTISARSRSQRTARSRSHSLSTESDSSPAEGGSSRQPRRRPRARARPPVEIDSDEEDEWISKSIESLAKPIPAHAALRPRLSTILSDDRSGTTATTSRALQAITNLAQVTNSSRVTSDTGTTIGPPSELMAKPQS